MIKVILRKSDKSANVAIPLEVCARLGFEAGQELTFIEAGDGLRIVKGGSEVRQQLEVAKDDSGKRCLGRLW